MRSNSSFSPGASLAALCLTALVIRCAYDAVLYLAMGNDGLMGVDSIDYLHRAQLFAAGLTEGKHSGWGWLGNDPIQMPLFTWTTSLSTLVSSTKAPLVYVFFQAVVDTATCVLIYRIAAQFDVRIALPAAVAAAINPTQIVLAGLFYPDTLFTFFVALLLLGAIRWLKAPHWAAAACVAIGFAGAVHTRILIAPFGVALIAFLLGAALVQRQITPRTIAQLGLVATVFALAVGTISMRNHAEYGAWQLTPQSGMHLNRWIVPLVQQAKDGTPWRETYEKLEARTETRFGSLADDQFERSQQYSQIAREELDRLGIAPMVKAWLYGASINMGTPAVLLMPPVMQLPRTGFYGTPGHDMPDKIFNFMFRSDNRVYAWILLAGIAGTAVFRMAQLVGVFALLRWPQNALGLLLLAGWCGYILLVNGPVASPKYRLPMEPALAILTGAGWLTLRGRSSPKPV